MWPFRQKNKQISPYNLGDVSTSISEINRSLRGSKSECSLNSKRSSISSNNSETDDDGSSDEKKVHSKMQFINNTLHELRVPFNAIYMGLDLLKEEEESKLSPEGKEVLDAVINACRSMKELIDDTLDFAKMESGSFAIRPAPFSMTTLLTETVKRMAPFAKDKDNAVALKVHCAKSSLDVNVYADKGRVQQVLANCISNAIKFSGKDGSGKVTIKGSVLDDRNEICIEDVWWKDESPEGGSFNPIILNDSILDNETSLVLENGNEFNTIGSIDGKPEYQHHTVLFSVKDNGTGIKREDFPKLFKSFQQLDGGLKSKHSGTGLGLTICKEIVRLHHGRIGVRSSGIPGDGTEFFVALRLPVIHQSALVSGCCVYGLSKHDNEVMTTLMKSRARMSVSSRVDSENDTDDREVDDDEVDDDKRSDGFAKIDEENEDADKINESINELRQAVDVSLGSSPFRSNGDDSVVGLTSEVRLLNVARRKPSFCRVKSPGGHPIYRILVVDDVASNRKLLRRSLEIRFRSIDVRQR